MRDELLGTAAVLGMDGDAHARGEAQVLPLDAERQMGDGPHDPLCQRTGLSLVSLRHQHGELVATKAREDLVAPGQRVQFAGNTDQHRVPGPVPVGVVDVLELVEIEEQQRTLAPEALIGCEHAAEFFLEAVTVVYNPVRESRSAR